MKYSYVKIAFMLVFMLVVNGCASTKTKQEVFPKMYSEKPLSILVVPAVNESTSAEAIEYLSTTLAEPLTQHGYYVPSIELTNFIFNNEGIVNGEQLSGIAPEVIGKNFGVDAILYTTIHRWDTSYYVIGGNVQVDLSYQLKSTKTNELIWSYREALTIDTGSSDANPLVAMVVTAINTAAQDYIPVAKQVNRMALASAPFGQYSEKHDKDQQQPVNSSKTVKQ